ncbi:MAG: DNA repair protein RecN [Chitinophagales bacterium]|nr:DNA repair protein RecN [Chitinophagales bacterium]
MLRKLTVRNYAIIDHLEIAFSPSLNIITGETGAGKSILLGALSLILGDRAESRSLFDESEKCVVEGVFDIAAYGLESFFGENDLDFEPTTIIRREINTAGKSRAFVNDTPVNLPILKQLGAQLVNLHSQHETLELSSASFQLQLLDTMAANDEPLKSYQLHFRQYYRQRVLLDKLESQSMQEVGDLDYINYQYQELEEASLQTGEYERLEGELKLIENAESIKAALERISQVLDGEQAATSLLTTAQQAFRQVSGFDNELDALKERLQSAAIEVQDIAAEVGRFADKTAYDPERQQEITERLNQWNRLLAKHHLKTGDELIALREQLQAKISGADQITQDIAEAKKQLILYKELLEQAGKALSENRKAQITVIEKMVADRLSYVGMPDARLMVELQLQAVENATIEGMDKVRFLFSANKGSRPDELKRIASGGELSRLMLVLKSLIAKSTALPTLIFDEIDTGVSGEVAHKVGQVLQELGEQHQVISITHLPQIASKGQYHLFVYKGLHNGKTVSRIKSLDSEERTLEIAKMLGGEKVSDAALHNAKELLSLS